MKKPRDVYLIGRALNRVANALLASAVGAWVVHGLAKEGPGFKRTVNSGAVGLKKGAARAKAWAKRKLQRQGKKEVANSEPAGQFRGAKPDESRFSSTVGWVNLSKASPTEYIRAELWHNVMRKFSNGEMDFQTATEHYRAALKRLGIGPVEDGEKVEDRRGVEKDKEILRILRESHD